MLIFSKFWLNLAMGGGLFACYSFLTMIYIHAVALKIQLKGALRKITQGIHGREKQKAKKGGERKKNRRFL